MPRNEVIIKIGIQVESTKILDQSFIHSKASSFFAFFSKGAI